ncbi:MAG: hypothetical protein Q4P22_06670 [Eubacteriales bacterium]|nr:hypothetical protein [Eubacteriales bacterium]
MAKSVKLKEADTFIDTEGIRDFEQGKTQAEINAVVAPMLHEASNWKQTFGNGWTVECIRSGNYCRIKIISEATNITAVGKWSDGFEIGILPEMYRPIIDLDYLYLTSDDIAIQSSAYIYITATGSVKIFARATEIPAKSYVRACTIYPSTN